MADHCAGHCSVSLTVALHSELAPTERRLPQVTSRLETRARYSFSDPMRLIEWRSMGAHSMTCVSKHVRSTCLWAPIGSILGLICVGTSESRSLRRAQFSRTVRALHPMA